LYASNQTKGQFSVNNLRSLNLQTNLGVPNLEEIPNKINNNNLKPDSQRDKEDIIA